jgi:hypothetical protein
MLRVPRTPGHRVCRHNAPMARGGRRKAERAQNHLRGPLLLALVAVLALGVTAVALVVGPSAQAPDSPEAAGSPSPSPSPSAPSAPGTRSPLDLSKLPVARTLTCGAVDDAALATALGGAPTEERSYVSGERVRIAPGVTDTAHEDLCGFESANAEARVWVFAASVGTPQARRVVRDVRDTPRCTFPADATGFGTPTLTSVCTRDDAVVTTLRGLFGDAWLSCELAVSGPAGADAVRTRADRWCVHVATTLGARP